MAPLTTKGEQPDIHGATLATAKPNAAARARMKMQKLYPFSHGSSEDIAAVALFLASDDSRMLTGSTIAADGGRSTYLRIADETD